MTMDERIEAAARTTGWYDALNEQDKADARDRIGVMFAAAFPELSGDKPGWMAPWEITEDMANEMECQFSTEGQWAAARDAYLGKGDGG